MIEMYTTSFYETFYNTQFGIKPLKCTDWFELLLKAKTVF